MRTIILIGLERFSTVQRFLREAGERIIAELSQL
jgi:hypothetical protein